jgi:hypothetical protein
VRPAPERAPEGLADLERRVRAAVTGGAAAEEILAPIAALAPAEQVRVYRDGWFSRLHGILKGDFPGVAAAAGEEAFETLARAYLGAHPPHDPNITWIGERFAEFLASREGLERRDLLADLARLEWAVSTIFDRPDGPVLDTETLRGVSPGRVAGARFPRAATAEVHEFRHPVHAFLDAVRRGEKPAPPGPAPCAVLVSRAGTRVLRMPLEPAALAAIRALHGGATLAEAVDAAAAVAGGAAEDLPARVTAWFAEWARNGAFAGVELPEGDR